MMAILQGRLNLLLCLIFPVFLLAGLLLSRAVNGMRREMSMMEYATQRGPVDEPPALPPEEERVPGYTTMTWQDYKEIMDALQDELAKKR